MNEENKEEKCCHHRKCKHNHSAFGGGVYFFAFIGAAIYFIQYSTSFWMGVLGILKAIVWPALLIYKVFTMIGM